MPQFILKIDLGNDDTRIPGILHNIASDIFWSGVPEKKHDIRDINGNVVGHYEVMD